MTLPEEFCRYGGDILKDASFAYSWSEDRLPEFCSILIPKQNDDGYEISIEAEDNAIIIAWGNWHMQLDKDSSPNFSVEYVFGLLRDMLSPNMRIRELLSNGKPYCGKLEAFDGNAWKLEEEMCLLFYNYFGHRAERIYQNNLLPGRLME